MENENNQKNYKQYSLNCAYRNGKIYRTALEVDGIATNYSKWNGQHVTSFMNALNLKDYIQTIQQTHPEKLHEKMKELKYPLLKLCELTGIDVNQIDALDYIVRIHQFAVWLVNLINAKNNSLEYFKIELKDITMEYSLSEEYDGCSMVRYTGSDIFLLAQIEFAEYYKSGITYIVCQKCNTIYFTHKVKSTKTCPFCVSPSLDKDTRAIAKQAERLYNSDPKLFEQKFIDYLIKRKHFSREEAFEEYNRQLRKRVKED
jgi:hypothetical protein